MKLRHFFFIVILALTFGCEEKNPVDSQGANDQITLVGDPDAVIALGTGGNLVVGQPVNFTAAQSSGGRNESITEIKWNIDNSTSFGMNTSHVFQQPGSYNIGLEIMNSAGYTDRANLLVNLTGSGNKRPTVFVSSEDSEFEWPQDSTVSLYAEADDEDGSITQKQWVVSPSNGAHFTDESNESTTLVVRRPGVYTATFYAEDNQGAYATHSTTVYFRTPDNSLPNAFAKASHTRLVDPSNTSTLEGYDSDTDGIIVSRQWKVVPDSGAVISNPNQSVSSVTFSEYGVYTFTYEVIDDDNATRASQVVVSYNPPAKPDPIQVMWSQHAIVTSQIGHIASITVAEHGPNGVTYHVPELSGGDPNVVYLFGDDRVEIVDYGSTIIDASYTASNGQTYEIRIPVLASEPVVPLPTYTRMVLFSPAAFPTTQIGKAIAPRVTIYRSDNTHYVATPQMTTHNPNVAIVDGDSIRVIGYGETTVTASFVDPENNPYSIEIPVLAVEEGEPFPVFTTSVMFSQTVVVTSEIGLQTTITTTEYLSDGTVINGQPTLVSNDLSVATTNSNVITTVAFGETTVDATYLGQSGSAYQITIPVMVSEPVLYAPKAVITASGSNVVGETITLSGAFSSQQQGHPIDAYRWEDINGQLLGENVELQQSFSSAGNHAIVLRVTSQGIEGIGAVVLSIDEPGQPPVNRSPVSVLTFTASDWTAPAVVTAHLGRSFDPDGDQLIGFRLIDLASNTTVNDSVATFSYTEPGNYTVIGEVKDSEGNIGQIALPVTILPAQTAANHAPTAVLYPQPCDLYIPLVVRWHGSQSFDVDGDPITIDYFDPADPNTVLHTGDYYDVAYNTPGIKSMGIRVTDSNGVTDVDVKTVTVMNSPRPDAVIDYEITSVVAPGAVNLNAHLSQGTGSLSYQWMLPDSTVLSNDISFNHANLDTGFHRVILKVTNQYGMTSYDVVGFIVLDSLSTGGGNGTPTTGLPYTIDQDEDWVQSTYGIKVNKPDTANFANAGRTEIQIRWDGHLGDAWFTMINLSDGTQVNYTITNNDPGLYETTYTINVSDFDVRIVDGAYELWCHYTNPTNTDGDWIKIRRVTIAQ